MATRSNGKSSRNGAGGSGGSRNGASTALPPDADVLETRAVNSELDAELAALLEGEASGAETPAVAADPRSPSEPVRGASGADDSPDAPCTTASGPAVLERLSLDPARPPAARDPALRRDHPRRARAHDRRGTGGGPGRSTGHAAGPGERARDCGAPACRGHPDGRPEVERHQAARHDPRYGVAAQVSRADRPALQGDFDGVQHAARRRAEDAGDAARGPAVDDRLAGGIRQRGIPRDAGGDVGGAAAAEPAAGEVPRARGSSSTWRSGSSPSPPRLIFASQIANRVQLSGPNRGAAGRQHPADHQHDVVGRHRWGRGRALCPVVSHRGPPGLRQALLRCGTTCSR